jgi:Rrf2 family transcriptional regulator, cysteine metabolism repressor
MKISRTIGYAIQATVWLALRENSIPIPCSRIAHENQLPERYLLQILRNLVNHGVLCSTRGVEGGYYLARLPSQISVLHIVAAFENPLEVSWPPVEGITFDARTRILATLRQASQAASYELNKLTIADLVAIVERSELAR